jgi:hypothetical protein
VKILSAGDLAAVAGEVNAAAFRAAQTLSDLSEDGWLTKAVRAHDRVIWEVFTQAAVLPSRFGALFATPQALTAWLRTERRRLYRALDLVRDVAEWDVEVQAPSDVDGIEVPDMPSSTAWMLSCQLDSVVCQTVHHALAALAVRSQDGFYLVRRADEGAFMRKVDDLVSQFAGTQIKITGPQPVYHLVEEAAARDPRAALARAVDALPDGLLAKTPAPSKVDR